MPEQPLPQQDNSVDQSAPNNEPKRPHGPDHPKVQFLAMTLIVLLSVAGGFLGGWLASSRPFLDTVGQQERVVLNSQGELINQISDQVGKSVVSINVESQGSRGFGMGGVQEGAGTGIVLTDDGLIVTNRHVVPVGTTKVSIILSDGTEFDDVTVVGRTGSSDSLDVAFLKVNNLNGQTLTPAKLGDSTAIKVGDAVVAIGNALGQFQNTVTSGIISGYGRSVQASSSDGLESGSLENLFQTDAAINQGNSGGPLVNMNGEVIGINTAVAAGGAQGIGFAIPIGDVVGLITSVKEKGILERPFLGVIYIPVTNDTAKQFNLSVDRGAFIPSAGVVGADSIINDSPAEKAGLKEGDIITKINDIVIDQKNSLSGVINKFKVGDAVTLTVIRDGQEQQIQVTLAAAPTS